MTFTIAFIVATIFAVLFAARAAYNIVAISNNTFNIRSYNTGIRYMVNTMGVPDQVLEAVSGCIKIAPAVWCALASLQVQMELSAFAFVVFMLITLYSCYKENKAFTRTY